MDAITYALCKKIAAGAVSGVTSMSVSGQTLTINCTDGTVLTMNFPTPADGVSITGVEVNASKHLIVTLSDSSTLDAGEVPTVQGETGLGVKGVTINASNHLIVTFDDDTTEDAGEIKGIHTSFSDITDIAVSELVDGQILQYDATSGKWKNVSPGSVDTDLGDLNDVDLTNIQDGQMIAWDAQNSKWVNVTPSADIESLNDIDDVDLTNPSNGQMLKYNGTSEKWENSDMPTIDATPTENSANAVQSGGVFTALGNKVDKVSGKGLSTEDYTSEEKTKLSGIETGAEANVQSDWNQSNNEADDFIKNKPSLGTAAAKDSTTYISPGNNDVPTANSVYQAMTSMLEGAFHPAGSKTCAELTSALLIQDNVGNVYKITDNGTTDANWVGGAGQTITANQMAVVVCGNEPDTFLFNLENGINIDMSQYQTKTITPITVDGTAKDNVEDALSAINDLAAADKTAIGNIKDGQSIDSFGDVETALADKAGKVSSATNGHFAGLDANGNLTDSGKSASDFATPSDIQDVYKANGVLGAKNLLKVPYHHTAGVVLPVGGSVENAGLTYTHNADGSLSVSGTATTGSYCIFNRKQDWADCNFYGKKIKMSVTPITQGAFMQLYDTDNGVTLFRTDASTGEVEFTMPESLVNNTSWNISLNFPAGAALNGETFYSMVRLASDTDSTYQPYAKTNKELTENLTPQYKSLKNNYDSTLINTTDSNVYALVYKTGHMVQLTGAIKFKTIPSEISNDILTGIPDAEAFYAPITKGTGEPVGMIYQRGRTNLRCNLDLAKIDTTSTYYYHVFYASP